MLLTTKAATIWTGPPISESNGNAPDEITDNVWLTRGSSQGLYNAVTESGFTHFLSPADTEWADGTTASYATLSYTDWNTWSKNIHGGPPNTVGVNAVLHLITDDIYIDITFTSWSPGGTYSYQRSTPATGNTPPAVSLTSPFDGEVFAAPASITLQASAADSDGTVTNVQFLNGSTVLTNLANAPFVTVASNLPAGTCAFSVIASDDGGATATNSVTVSVVTPVPVTLSQPRQLTPGTFQFTYTANAGLYYLIQRSTNLNLLVWSTLATNFAGYSSMNYTDTGAAAPRDFYRVGRLPNP